MNCAIASDNYAATSLAGRPVVPALLALLIGLGICLFAATAVAADDPDALLDSLSAEEEMEVIELIDLGEEQYDRGDFEAALGTFTALYEFFPHPDINYRIALCHERLGNDALAIQHYRQFLEQVPDAPERGRVESTIATIERRLGDAVAQVRVETFPIGAQIFLDSTDTAPVGETPRTVQVTPGSIYEVIVVKDGYEPARKSVTVAQGQQDLIQFRLVESRAAADRGTTESGIAMWKPLTTIAMTGAGGVALFMSRGRYSEYRRMDGNRGQYERDEVERERDLALAFGATGGALLLGSAVFTTWWVIKGSSDDGATLSLIPTSESLSVGVSGRF